MLKNRYNTVFFLFNFALLCIIMLIQYNGIISIKIANANPMLPLAFLIAVSMFTSELTATMSALFIGIITDGIASTTFGFHSICFFLIGFFTSLIIHYLFNNNLRSAIALGIIFSAIYFLLRWLFFNGIGHSIDDSLNYLFKVAMPSAVYTAVFVIPFYYFEKIIYKKFAN